MEEYRDAPMILLLCKIPQENERQEKEQNDRLQKGQDSDPRVPYDVLVEEGISPNLGPSSRRSNALRVVAPMWGHAAGLTYSEQREEPQKRQDEKS